MARGDHQGGPTGVYGVPEHPMDREVHAEDTASESESGDDVPDATTPSTAWYYAKSTLAGIPREKVIGKKFVFFKKKLPNGLGGATWEKAPGPARGVVMTDPVSLYHKVIGFRLTPTRQAEYETSASPLVKMDIMSTWKGCLDTLADATLGKFRIFCMCALAISTTDPWQAELLRMSRLELEADGRPLAFKPPPEGLTRSVARVLHGDLVLENEPKHVHPWSYVDKIISSVASVMKRINREVNWRHGNSVVEYLKKLRETDGDGKRTNAIDPVEDFPKLWDALWKLPMSMNEKIRSMRTRDLVRRATASCADARATHALHESSSPR